MLLEPLFYMDRKGVFGGPALLSVGSAGTSSVDQPDLCASIFQEREPFMQIIEAHSGLSTQSTVRPLSAIERPRNSLERSSALFIPAIDTFLARLELKTRGRYLSSIPNPGPVAEMCMTPLPKTSSSKDLANIQISSVLS